MRTPGKAAAGGAGAHVRSLCERGEGTARRDAKGRRVHAVRAANGRRAREARPKGRGARDARVLHEGPPARGLESVGRGRGPRSARAPLPRGHATHLGRDRLHPLVSRLLRDRARERGRGRGIAPARGRTPGGMAEGAGRRRGGGPSDDLRAARPLRLGVGWRGSRANRRREGSPRRPRPLMAAWRLSTRGHRERKTGRNSGRGDSHRRGPRRGCRPPVTTIAHLGAGAYGHFSEDGREYVITDPRTPRPWVNVVANPSAGFVVSKTGSGFSFLENAQLAVVTRWQQDLVEDLSGKFLYVKDTDGGDLWSLSPAPAWAPFDSFACRHGLGYTTFETSRSGIEARWTLFCHEEETAEIWRVTLRNTSGRPRKLLLCGTLEWCCGVAPAPRREFGKLFLETKFDADHRAIVARIHMWEVPSPRFGHWNTSFPYVSVFSTSEAVVSAQGDKAAFLGRYGSLRAPAALLGKGGAPAFGRHEDPIAALEVEVVLEPGESRTIGFALATSESEEEAAALGSRFVSEEESRRALEEVTAGWRG